jgi:uncharacterized protein YndB with AHSA1/START domain/uncharacterized protein YciI
MSTAAQPRRPARAVADLTTGTILASVDIAAPAERIFAALTTDEVTRWWGSPEAYQTTSWQADLRVGGRWRAGGVMPDGASYVVEGEYLEVDPPRRLVHTWRADWDGGAVTTVTYELAPIPGGTRVTLRHDGFAGRADSCQAHGDGWEAVLGWLERHLAAAASPAAGATAPAAKPYVFRLHPPRPSFPFDMTAAEGEVMQAHAAHWARLLEAGVAVVFGPVADPAGAWGLAVARVADEAELAALLRDDPAVLSGMGFRLEALPMLQAVTRG